MAAALLFVAALLAGLAWARLMPGRPTRPEWVASGGVAGLLGGAWLSWLTVLVGGGGFAVLVAPPLLLGLAGLGVWRARAGAPALRPVPRGLWRWWLGTTVPLSALLGYLASTHFLRPLPGGVWTSAGSTWGDLPLHASLAARFAQQSRFEWGFPLLAGAPMTYPFLPDLWSGLLHRGGASLRWALLAPTLVLLLALVQLLFFVGWRATRRRGGAALCSLLVLFDGGVAGLPISWRELQASGLPPLDFLRTMKHDFAHVPAINLRFSNLVCDALLPQRGMLAGMGALLVAVLLLRGTWERERVRKASRRSPLAGSLVAAGVLLGLLPFVHVHTFLVLAGVMAWMAVARWRQDVGWGVRGGERDRGGGREGGGSGLRQRGRGGARGWGVALGLGLLLAAPQLGWQLGHANTRSFSHWHLGWMTEPGESPWAFWLRNLGILLPFLATSPWWLHRWPARGFWLHLLAPCLALFAVANLYLFQPHAYDNLKLLFYAYLAVALGSARLLASWWRRRRMLRPLAAACVLLATGGGVLSLAREATLRWPLLDGDEVALGMTLRHRTPADSRFLTGDRHNHPVPMVAGRRIVLGYRGWLWTYGFDTGAVLEDVEAIYRGAATAPALLRRYGVDYVVVGPPERQAFSVDEAFFAARYPLLLARGGYHVYSVGGTNPVAQAGRSAAKRSASK